MKYTEPSNSQRLGVLQASNQTERMINCANLLEMCPISQATLWRLIQQDEFPKPYKIGRRRAWRISSVLWFIQQLEEEIK